MKGLSENIPKNPSPKENIAAYFHGELDTDKAEIAKTNDGFTLEIFNDKAKKKSKGVYYFDKNGKIIKFSTGLTTETINQKLETMDKKRDEIRRQIGLPPKKLLWH